MRFIVECSEGSNRIKILILWYYSMRATSRIFNESWGVAFILSSNFLHGLSNIFKSPSVTNYSVLSCGLTSWWKKKFITHYTIECGLRRCKHLVEYFIFFIPWESLLVFFWILNFQFSSIFLLFTFMRLRTAVLLKYAWIDERTIHEWVKREKIIFFFEKWNEISESVYFLDNLQNRNHMPKCFSLKCNVLLVMFSGLKNV